jgi:hypothetical protein
MLIIGEISMRNRFFHPLLFILAIVLISGLQASSQAGWHLRFHRAKHARDCPAEKSNENTAKPKENDSKEKATLTTGAGTKLIEAGEFTDGGTCYAKIKLPSGEELSFGISSPDCEDIFPPNRLYVGHIEYRSPKVRLVEPGSEEEKRIIKALEDALRPYDTKEAEEKLKLEMKELNEKSDLPPHPPFGPPPFGVEPAKTLLLKLQKLTNKD